MFPSSRKILWVLGGLFMILLADYESWAYNTSPSNIPNGNAFSCNTCHAQPSGLNKFGQAFNDNFFQWNSKLAELDSDGDGATNGVELQDPNGSWFPGFANPGNAALVTNPGDPNSKPVAQAPTPTPLPIPTPTPPAPIFPSPTSLVFPTQPILPTPTNTSTPLIIYTPTSIQVPIESPQPILVYEFDQSSIEAGGWKEIPGGFGNAPRGQSIAGTFFGNPIPSSTDKKGLQILVNPKEVVFLYAVAPVQTQGKPVLLRMTLRVDNPNAGLALVALKGNLGTGATDGSIATHVPASAAGFIDIEKQLVLIYQPDAGELITPALQVAATGQTGSVTVLIDKVEVYLLDYQKNYSGNLFYTKP